MKRKLDVLGVELAGKDPVILILAFFLAAGIWFLYGLSQDYSELMKVYVEARCNVDGHSDRSSNSPIVMARCRTTGYDIIRSARQQNRKKPRPVVFEAEDLHHYGNDTYFITAMELNKYVSAIFGDKASLESFVTDSVFFRFPEENSRKVPVKPEYKASYKMQYTKVGDMLLTPDSVIVYGEVTYTANVDAIYTKPFHLDNLSVPAHGTVKLKKLNGLRMSAEKADYLLDVKRYVEIRSEMPVNVRNVPRGHTLIVYPATVTATFRCAFPVEADPTKEVEFYVDYEDFAESLGGRCLIRADKMPPGVLDYSTEPHVAGCIESVR